MRSRLCGWPCCCHHPPRGGLGQLGDPREGRVGREATYPRGFLEEGVNSTGPARYLDWV